MEKVLEISHLSRKFGQQYALNDVNVTIRKGDVYGLIGKNGAGKTTLIKVITQLIQETDGSVSLFASTNRSQWTQALKRVGSVIESPVAHKHMTAYQNLVYYCKARHIPNPDQANIVQGFFDDLVGIGDMASLAIIDQVLISGHMLVGHGTLDDGSDPFQGLFLPVKMIESDVLQGQFP